MPACDLCGDAKGLRCFGYYPERGEEQLFIGVLCAECHHGGPKKEEKLTVTASYARGPITAQTIRIVDVPLVSDE